MTRNQAAEALSGLNLTRFAWDSKVSRRTLTRIIAGDDVKEGTLLLIERALKRPQLKRIDNAKKEQA